MPRTPPPASRIEVPEPPEWGPLLQLVGPARCAQFMAMGQVRQGETTIFLYKHIWTRRYLNLAWHGQAHRFTRKGTYEPISLAEGILRLFAEGGAENPLEGQSDAHRGAGS